MAKKHKPQWQTLGWYEARNCWSKYYKGKRYYLKGDGSATRTRDNHDAAMLQWLKQKQELAGSTINTEEARKSADYLRAADLHEDIAEVVDHRESEKEHREKAEQLREAAKDPKSPAIDWYDERPLRQMSEIGAAIMHDRIKTSKKQKAKQPKNKTIAQAIDEFCDFEDTRCEAGQIAKATATAIRWRLKTLKDYSGATLIEGVPVGWTVGSGF